MEIFVEINDFKGYEVSNKGSLKSKKHKSDKILSPVLDKNGYCKLNLWKNNKQYTFRVHQLVAKTFIPNPLNKPEVNHINRIKNDNRVENLEWVTAQENKIHYNKTRNHGDGKRESADKP